MTDFTPCLCERNQLHIAIRFNVEKEKQVHIRRDQTEEEPVSMYSVQTCIAVINS
jgi:hypothetical protein